MKENKNNSEQGGTNQKAFWIIGIAIIVFLILVFGSIVGLKITRDGIGKINGGSHNSNGSNDVQNYIVSEDGTKSNTSKQIKSAEFDFDGRKISNFTIEEKEGVTTVKANIENTTDNTVPGATFLVKLYDADGNVITEYSMITAELAPKAQTMTVTPLLKDCANAASVGVDMVAAQ